MIRAAGLPTCAACDGYDRLSPVTVALGSVAAPVRASLHREVTRGEHQRSTCQ